MFNMYRRRFYARSGPSNGSDEQLGHDRFNYMHPNVNYDKWPRRLRPKKSVAKVELEAPESPNTFEDPRCFIDSDFFSVLLGVIKP